MKLGKLVTLGFDPNVGTFDRIFRVATGVPLIAVGWVLGWPVAASAIATFLGVTWTASGVLSRCSIYYLFGYSTCPLQASAGEKESSR